LKVSGLQEGSLVWKISMKRLMFVQLIVPMVAGFFLLFWWSGIVAVSFMAGGVLVSLNSWVMARAFVVDEVDQKSIYRSAVLRYIGLFLILYFCAAVGVDLLAVCGGMFAAYMAGFIFSARCTLSSCKDF